MKILIAVLILALGGCTTYHERNGELKPNRPSAKELREICPM